MAGVRRVPEASSRRLRACPWGIAAWVDPGREGYADSAAMMLWSPHEDAAALMRLVATAFGLPDEAGMQTGGSTATVYLSGDRCRLDVHDLERQFSPPPGWGDVAQARGTARLIVALIPFLEGAEIGAFIDKVRRSGQAVSGLVTVLA